MMKKSLIFLGLLALALVVAGCSQFGAGGNPNELTGTWTSSTKVYDSTSAGTIAGTAEGTWEKTSTTLPTPTLEQTDEIAGYTWKTYYDNEIVTKTEKAVIGSDGGYTYTKTEAYTKAARAAITAVYTGAQRTNGYVAIPESAVTKTTTITAVVTLNADKSYTELVTTKSVVTAGTGDYAAGYPAKTSTTQVQTSVNLASSALSFNNVKVGTQTAAPAGNGSTKDKVTEVATSLVITADGAYTWTATSTTTITGPVAGTQKVTVVKTGTVTGANDSQKVVTFNQTNVKRTYVGTGSGIMSGIYQGSPYAFPATEITLDEAATANSVYQYYLTKGSKSTYLQLFSTDGLSSEPLLSMANK